MTQITLKQLKSAHCHTRVHCRTCRTDADWRERVTGVRDFECPHGVTADNIPSTGLGDTIAKITKSVGGHFHDLVVDKYNVSPCAMCVEVMDEMDQLGPDGCDRERQRLINGIWGRRNNLSGWRKIAAKLPGAEHQAKRELNVLLDHAIYKTQQTHTLRT